MNPILFKIRTDLKASVDAKTLQSFQRFFKEQVKAYGVKTAVVAKIAKKYWPEVETLGKPELFRLCEALLGSGYTEEAFIVSNWLPEYIDKLEATDIGTFKRWIETYIDNWAKCDSFCNHTIGDLIQKYPQVVAEVKSWALSKNRWLKRASAVSFIVPAKKGLFLSDTFEICNTLLLDEDDLVQKGYGWLLKEESRKHQSEVFNFVIKNREVIPGLRFVMPLN